MSRKVRYGFGISAIVLLLICGIVGAFQSKTVVPATSNEVATYQTEQVELTAESTEDTKETEETELEKTEPEETEPEKTDLDKTETQKASSSGKKTSVPKKKADSSEESAPVSALEAASAEPIIEEPVASKQEQTTSSSGNSTSNAGNTNQQETKDERSYCYLSISCAGFLDDISEEIVALLPDAGGILGDTKVQMKAGDTVYDILERVCVAKQIPLNASESTWGVYVKAIDNLSEKYIDWSSGWTYMVNGESPMVGCSAYQVKENDIIAWNYDTYSW